MAAKTQVQGGVCGFVTTATASSSDDQQVNFELTSDCANIERLANALQTLMPFDAYQEIRGADHSRLLRTAREQLTGCCAGCVVPVALFKAMQVAAGLALPADVHVSMTKE